MKSRKIIFANWKMNLDSRGISNLVQDILSEMKNFDNLDVILSPPFPYLKLVSDLIRGSKLSLSSQNVFYEDVGSYTGEVSTNMLKDVGCDWVMMGHSERRQHLLETNEMINKKILASTHNGLNAILCVGESFDERRHNKTFVRISDQLKRGLRDVKYDALPCIVIGYEPIWVIGSGEPARLKDIQEVQLHHQSLLMILMQLVLLRILIQKHC